MLSVGFSLSLAKAKFLFPNVRDSSNQILLINTNFQQSVTGLACGIH